MEKLKALWKDMVESLWFWPGLLTLSCGALALLLVRYDDEIKDLLGLDPEEMWWLFGGAADGAMDVLAAIAGSIMTVTGVVFSVTIIALQLASSQYTPRVLRQFMAHRANQLTLGVFIGTFTYALLVLRTVRTDNATEEFIPSLAVTVAVLLTLTSMGFLIYFINHVARSMQAPVIIDSVARDGLRVLAEVYPEEVHEWTESEERSPEEIASLDDSEAFRIRAAKAGYVQAVERASLLRFTTEHDLLVRMEAQIGTHVLPGEVTMKVWPARRVTGEMETRLRDVLVLGKERTPHQDLRHVIIEMMDIAVKALSPSVNDPTTAINVIHRLAQVLLDMAWRESGPALDRDDAGSVRVIVRRPDLAHVAALAYGQIRHYGAGNATVMISLLDNLADLAALSPDPARQAFADQINLAITSARERMTNPADTARLEEAIERALARSREQAPRQRPQRA
ncbi:MAG TPA: DUF2254 domain-containing protein [Longimicrobiales bacterium]|nr:DUF2254 domain-containing protein [Longimicrobiales bacterium]